MFLIQNQKELQVLKPETCQIGDVRTLHNRVKHEVRLTQ